MKGKTKPNEQKQQGSLEMMLDKHSLARRAVEMGKKDSAFIEDLYQRLEEKITKNTTIDEKYEYLKKAIAQNNAYNDDILEAAAEYDVPLFKKGEIPIQKLSKKQYYDYLEKGTKMKLLSEQEIDCSDIYCDNQVPILQILRIMPTGANAYTEKYDATWTGELEDSETAIIDFYKIEK